MMQIPEWSLHCSATSLQRAASNTRQQQAQGPQDQLQAPEHLHSSACGRLQHSEAAMQERASAQPYPRLQAST